MKNHPYHFRRFSLVTAIAITLSPVSLHAADGVWTDTTAGPNDWSGPLNWSSEIADGPTSSATFSSDITATTTVNLDSSRNLGNLNFSDAGGSGSPWLVSTSNSSVLTLGDGVTAATSTIDNLTGSEINLVVAGANRLVKSGAARLWLTGANTYTGGTTINGFYLGINGDAALGAVPGVFTPDNIIFNNGTFSNFAVVANPNITLHANRGISLASGSGRFDISANTMTINGVISGIGGLSKFSTGTLVLTEANTYTGITTAGGGVLRLDHASALPGGVATTGGTSALLLNGGVIGLTAASGDFTRSIGTITPLTTQVNWSSSTATGGFAAFGGDRSVNFGGLVSPAQIPWSTVNRVFSAGLILGHATSDSTVTVANPINLNSTTDARTIIVNDGSADVDAIMSGFISNAGGFLIKAGTGTLALTATNTYGANFLPGSTFTTISAGTLQLGNGGTTGALTTTGTGDIQNDGVLAVKRTNTTSLAFIIKGTGAFSQIGTGTTNLSAANTYTGPTTISAGTLGLTAGSSASPITVGPAGSLRFTLDSPITSTASVTLEAGSKIKITGTPTEPSYTLITASEIVGTPVLDVPVTGYSITRTATTISLVQSTGESYATWATDNGIPGEPATGDFDFDGLSNLVEYGLGLDPKVSSVPAGTFDAVARTITFTKGSDAIANQDVNFFIEESDDLGITDLWTEVATQTAPDASPSITHTLPAGKSKVFTRLKVVQVP